ncbi:MAG: bifunctional methylenetetrahydrofolate dehydrogenase/methenyltetrahydrofolate cyclohydrolase FolD [Candidatus Latescibacteria bacterium]|nr:bifunctional methylenetetrahydrofolate dehydrogenase/methenyltetrahydrofolate cyclohydrolase FolD [Candidatus Latescibacterota bacterium]
MTAELLDGKVIARQIRDEVARAVARLKAERGIVPHLAAVLIGEDPGSQAYVRMKRKACEEAGIESETVALPETASQEQVLRVIDDLNARPDVSGILVQHPIPRHLNELDVFDRIAVAKDVDGVSPTSFGRLSLGLPAFRCCTPYGIMELLDRYHIPLQGKEAVVVGRSPILGKPMAIMLLARHATVTICHSRTVDLPSVTRRADVLVAAVGKPELITGDMIKPGAVVIDAGYNKVAGRSTLVGDVHFESAVQVASKITPVPGGVGPMTIAMLLKNTVEAAVNQHR